MKKCTKCKVEKELSCFSKNKNAKDALQHRCKECVKEDYQKNKEHRAKQKAEYYQKNRKELIKYQVEYRQDNKEEIAKRKAKYQQQNKEHIQEYQKKYRNKNRDKISIKQKKYREHHKTEALEYRTSRRKKDPAFKLLTNRRNRRHQILKNDQCNSTKEDLGCTPQEWRDYIESKFDENMTWDNYGLYWHLDEIVPCSAWKLDKQENYFELTNEQRQKACFHYLNSQPLEKSENMSRPDGRNKDFSQEIEILIKKLKDVGVI